MPAIIDADTHIAESESMWRYFDRGNVPSPAGDGSAPDDTVYRDFNVLWLIDGKIFPKASGKGGFRIITPTASKREAGSTDISPRLPRDHRRPGPPRRHGQSRRRTQVIYPTLFLIHVTDDVNSRVALCDAYNKFLGEVYRKSNNRLRWVTVLPLQSVDESIKQMHDAKQKRRRRNLLQRHRRLADIEQSPFYADLCGSGEAWLADLRPYRPKLPPLSRFFRSELNGTFATSHLPPILAFAT